MPLLALEPFIYPEDLLDHPANGGRWWVLHTRPRAEKSLVRRIHGRQMSYFLPLHQRQWRSGSRTFRSFLPLFPGYVFLHGDDGMRQAALETNLVAQFLPVEDQQQLHVDLSRVYQLLTTGAAVTPEDRLGPGDLVEIVKGPFAGLEGKVLRRGKQLRFVVEVHFLRQAVSVEMENWMLQPGGPTAVSVE